MALSRNFKLHLIALLLLVSLPLFGTQVDDFAPNDSGDAATVQPAKSITPDGEYLKDDIKPKRFDEDTWQKRKKGMQYGEKPKEEATKTAEEQQGPKEEETETEANNGLNLGLTGQVLLILAVVGILALLVFLAIKQGWLKPNSRIAPDAGKPILLEDLEDKLHETDLERALRLALEAKDYRMAIRIYYLSIIKELSALQWIYWKRDKTNGQYVREMGDRPNAAAFRQLTMAFDRAWYSDERIEQRHYEALSPQFKEFMNTLKKR